MFSFFPQQFLLFFLILSHFLPHHHLNINYSVLYNQSQQQFLNYEYFQNQCLQRKDDFLIEHSLIHYLPFLSLVFSQDLTIINDLLDLMLMVKLDYLLETLIPFLISFRMSDSHQFLQKVLYHLTFYREYNQMPINHTIQRRYCQRAFQEKHSKLYQQKYPYIILWQMVYCHLLNHPIPLFKHSSLPQNQSKRIYYN